jgi:hypothetical protein
MLATQLLFLNPPVKFNLIKFRDVADWWIPNVRISEQNVCYLNFIFVPREYCWNYALEAIIKMLLL